MKIQRSNLDAGKNLTPATSDAESGDCIIIFKLSPVLHPAHGGRPKKKVPPDTTYNCKDAIFAATTPRKDTCGLKSLLIITLTNLTSNTLLAHHKQNKIDKLYAIKNQDSFE